MINKSVNKNKSGFVLIASTLVVGAVMLLAYYFLNFILTDVKISQSQSLATRTYYLAEAGVHEAVWKIKNDPTWEINFQTDPEWSEEFTRDNPFGQNNSYTINVQNIALGEAIIDSPGSYDWQGITGQRIVETKVFQALNPVAPEEVVIFTDRDADFWGSIFTLNGGGIFANDDIGLSLWSTVTVEKDAAAVDNINISWTSNLNAENKYSINYPPAPAAIEMPQIDFDSEDPGSYANRADNTYTESEFQELMNNDPNLVINGITYVQGNVTIPRGQNLTVNGVLVNDGNISIGTSFWPFWKFKPIVIASADPDQPAGLLSKRQITIGTYTDEVNVSGLLYANDSITVSAWGVDFIVNGGIICRDFNGYDFWNPQTLTYNQTVIDLTINPGSSPIINIEHWEEEY
ncbi:hypothetical protein KKF32_01770 [Patescibacteria group bacterium]|nr:hypothetical protein [Patescibacteria group bacterium]